MRYAIIENGTVSNVVKSESALAENWIELQDGFGIGDLYEDGVFSKPPVDLDEYKASARTRLQDERNEIYTQPINNVQVARVEDLLNLQGYLLRETEEPIEWLMADNTTANLYLSDISAVLDAYAVRKRLAFEDFNAACRELDLATTQAEIDAIHVEIVE